MSDQLGKTLIGVGLSIAALGVLFMLAPKVGGFRFGRLPGDINVQREGFGIFVPITSMLVLSALFSLVMLIVGKIRR